MAILDDEAEIRKAIKRLLTVRGYTVEEYERGEDFLAALDAHPPSCLLLDLHMPGIDGFEVLAALRARKTPPPVIVITAHDEAGALERARALGAFAYLMKPVDRDTLLAAMTAAKAAGHPPTPPPSPRAAETSNQEPRNGT